MADTTLKPGDAWLGYFDHPTDSVRRVGMLKRGANSIQLHTPEEGATQDMLTKLASTQEPPRQVGGYAHFAGPQGTATLLGLRTWPAMLTLGPETGRGMTALTAEAAVFGTSPDTDYRLIKAMRTRVEGLEGFYRYTAVSVTPENDNGGFTVTVAGQQEEPIRPDGGLIVQTRSGVSTNSSGVHTLDESMRVISRTDPPEDYLRHLEMHRYIADLFTALNDTACHVYDIEVSSDGDTWHQLTLPSDGKRPPYRPTDTALPVVARSDLPDDCLFRWMDIYADWHREIAPLARLPRLNATFIDAQFSQLGVGLEGVGYRLCLESGLGEKKAANFWLQGRIEKIVQDLGSATKLIPESLPEEIADAYNGIKHANRELPTPQYLAWLLPQGVGLFQLWLIRRLGAADDLVHYKAAQMFPMEEAPEPS